MRTLTVNYVIGIAKSLTKKDLTAEQKEHRATMFFKDIIGDFCSGNISEKEVKLLNELIRTILGWDF